MIQFDKFTQKAQEAMQQAQSLAGKNQHQAIHPVHLLLALAAEKEGVVRPVLEKCGVQPAAIVQEAERALNDIPKVTGAQPGAYISPSLNDVVDRASEEAERFKDEFVSTEHLLLAMSRQKSDPAGNLLNRLGATHEKILTALVSVRGTQRITDPNPESKYQALERYATDLTEQARKGKLDPVIGRDDEIRRVMQVLSRRTKNNPVLIGEPGVGKTAIVEGLAHRIGATTLVEYKKYIEKDAALARRFQTVLVGEPSVEDTIAILRGLKERFEIHHGVRVKDAAIVAAATLSHRYISDRFLPDKAIDLIDEAGAALGIQIGSMPIEIDQLERRIIQLEIERQTLVREKDQPSRERLRTVESELERLRAESAGLKERWNTEKAAISRVQQLKEEQEKLRQDEERATRAGDWEKAAKIRYG